MQAAAAAMERAAGLRAQVDQLDGLVSLMDTASTAMELLDLEVSPWPQSRSSCSNRLPVCDHSKQTLNEEPVGSR